MSLHLFTVVVVCVIFCTLIISTLILVIYGSHYKKKWMGWYNIAILKDLYTRQTEPWSTSAEMEFILSGPGKWRDLLFLAHFPSPNVKLHWVTWIELGLCKLHCRVDAKIKRWGHMHTGVILGCSWTQQVCCADLCEIFERKAMLEPPVVHVLLQGKLSVHKQML